MWILFAIGGAFFAALNRTVMKLAGDRTSQQTIVFSRYFYGSFPALLLLLIVGIPEIQPAFYPAIFGAVVADLFAIAFMSMALHLSSMARAVPILAFTPVFLLITGQLLLGEFPSPIGLLGVLVIVAGSYWLAEERAQGDSLTEPLRMLFKDKGVLCMLGAALGFSIAGPLFKTAVLNSSPYLCLAVSLPLGSVIYGAYIGLKERSFQTIIPEKQNVRLLILLGIGVFGVALTTNWAFLTGLTSYVVSVKRLSILFNIMLGSLIFKEQDIKRYFLAGSIMVGGTVIIAFFS